MPLGEVFLGAFLGAILKALISPELVRFLRQEGFEKKIDKWRRTLEMINAVLGDAQEKQLTNEAVKIWLDVLEELAYDAEDMLDEFEYEATARMMKMDQLQSSKFWKHVPAGFCNWSLDAIKFRFRMRSKVNDVTTRFNGLCKRRQDLGLQVNTERAPSRSSAAPQRPPTTAHRTEPAVYGRDEDEEILLERVLKSEPTDDNLLVIPIVGMGGVGKTTLAREVFNASKVKFEVHAWVCVSDGEFDVTRISKSILENITGSSSGLPSDLATVHDKLKEQVAGKRFLLVLDDVWSQELDKWQILQSPFRASAAGSRIIVTTRDEGVALKLRPKRFHHRVSLLKPEECWLVFSMCAFENGAVQEHHEIELIREKVIEKSGGLPLAAKTLGGLLLSKQIDEWMKVLKSELWNLSENGGSEIPAALKLSYHHLPSPLKSCFAICAIFPKDHEFEIEEVVLLWIAEGLVQQSTNDEQLEELGNKYFSDLLGRSLFQQSSSDNGHKFVMHDLVHDLAQWAFGKRGLSLDDNGHVGRLEKVRHVSYTSEKYDGEERFKVFQEVEDLKARIRAFLLIPQDHYGYKFITKSVPFDLLPKLKRLRALSLQNYHNMWVSIPIGGLKHLRYLNLSRTEIRSLPESTSLLYNLQILLLRGCSSLVKLPSNFKYLIKLRHLDIKGAYSIKKMPLGMEKLQNLQKLSNFIVGKGVCSSLKDLMSLSMLHGKLCISRLDNVISCDCKILKDMEYLEKLLLDWGFGPHGSQSKGIGEERVLDMLQPHENLQELTITRYGGTEFPPWVGAASYRKIKVLTLKFCRRCTYLPPLGVLDSLEELTIKAMKELRCISSEFYGNGGNGKLFKSLKTLCFEDLPMWENWEPMEENGYGDAFPCLKMLSIFRCSKLSGSLPKRLSALEKLKIRLCEQLVVSFSNIPELCEIEIRGCKKITCDNPVDFKSMRYLKLAHISEFNNQLMQECFGKAELQLINHDRSEVQLDEICPEKLPVGGLQRIEFLTELDLSNCSNIVSFSEVCSLPHLSKLQISGCDALISLPEEMKIKNTRLESLTILCCKSLAFIVRGQLPPSIKWLAISKCDKLESLWDDRENDKNTNSSLLKSLCIESCQSLTFIVRGQLPPSLKRLDIKGCRNLKSLWDDRENANNTNSSLLESLSIKGCQSLTFIVRGQLPPSLKRLDIKGCRNLETLWDDRENANNANPSLLQYLCVIQCPSLTCLSSIIRLPATLKHLDLGWCPRLSTVTDGFHDSNMSLEIIRLENCANLQIPNGLHKLRHLRELTIWTCPNIECFPKEGLAGTNLSQLQIMDCENLKALPIGLRSINSLEGLKIWKCPNITSFNPEEELPTNLKSLHIDGCDNVYRPLVDWGLHNLTSLTCLLIRGFPLQETEMMLPPSLTRLDISCVPKLRTLPQGFQNLTLLQSLYIRGCLDLTSLGDQGLPSSLKYLSIQNCPKLACFPKQGLPSSLQELIIKKCPKLEEECKRSKGRERSKISNIAYVNIREQRNFELEENEEAHSSSCSSSCLANCHSMHCCNVLR